MKRLYECLDLINEDILHNYAIKHIDSNYDDIDNFVDYIYTGIKNLKNIKPNINNDIIVCLYLEDTDYDFDENESIVFTSDIGAQCVKLFVNELDGKTLDEIYINHWYSIEMLNKFEDVLGSYLAIDINENNTYIDGVIRILDSIFFLANSTDKLEERNNEIADSLEKAEQDIIEGNFYSTDELFASLDEDDDEIYDEDEESCSWEYVQKEMQHTQILIDKNRDEINIRLKAYADRNLKQKNAFIKNVLESQGFCIENGIVKRKK